jgi:hypothetical protein
MRPQYICPSRQLLQLRHRILGQDDAQLSGHSLQEEHPEELGGRLTSRTQLQHIGQQLRRPLGTQLL